MPVLYLQKHLVFKSAFTGLTSKRFIYWLIDALTAQIIEREMFDILRNHNLF